MAGGRAGDAGARLPLKKSLVGACWSWGGAGLRQEGVRCGAAQARCIAAPICAMLRHVTARPALAHPKQAVEAEWRLERKQRPLQVLLLELATLLLLCWQATELWMAAV